MSYNKSCMVFKKKNDLCISLSDMLNPSKLRGLTNPRRAVLWVRWLGGEGRK